MKKLLITAAALAMLASLPMTALAEKETLGENGSRKIDVQAKYVDGVTTQDVYSVDVEWGAMQFTYNVSGTKTWNPSDHSYSTPTDSPQWTADGNTVTVTNHSNQPVEVAFRFDKDAAVTEEITGSFDKTSATLAAGVEGDYDNADSVTAALTLSGALGSDKTDFTKVGEITVELS